MQNNVDYYIHEGKQHGLCDFIDSYDWLAKDISLVICPDSASNDYEYHAILKKYGVDCLILDHHETDGGYSKDACTINN